jgi:hypothetical protein
MSPVVATVFTDAGTPRPDLSSFDSEVVELALLLPRWQAMALLTAAQQRGISAGQMLRRIIVSTVGSQPPLANS